MQYTMLDVFSISVKTNVSGASSPAAALRDDFEKELGILKQAGVGEITVVAFPRGATSALTDTLLRQMGVKVTLTTDAARVNILSFGRHDSLIGMGRLTMHDGISDEALKSYLTGAINACE